MKTGAKQTRSFTLTDNFFVSGYVMVFIFYSSDSSYVSVDTVHQSLL